MRNRRLAELAADVMGVSLDGLTSVALGAAYKELIKLHHPDAGGEHEDFVRLQQAKKELLKWLDGSSEAGSSSTSLPSSPVGACTVCGGTGIRKVVNGFSTMRLRCIHCETRET